MKNTADHAQHRVGSYHIDVYQNKQQEIDRLNLQAKVAFDREFNCLLNHGLSAATNILDVACGTGNTTIALAEAIPTKKFSGIEINASLLDIARESAGIKQLPVDFYEANVYEHTLDQTFDFMYCRFVFQHLKSTNLALESLSRNLQQGGRICFCDVNDEWQFIEPLLPAFEELKNLTVLQQERLGGNRLIAKQLPTLLKAHGFGNIKIDVLPIDSEMMGMRQFLNLTQSFKTEVFKEPEEQKKAKTLLQEITEEATNGNYFGMTCAFMVSGEKL